MPRYVQKVNPDGTSRFVEVGKPDTAKQHYVHGDIEAFVSPIDRTVISDRKQYREHCEKHGVVPAQEFSAEHYKQAAEKRARFFQGQHSKQERVARRQQMYNIAMDLERKNGR